MDCLQRGIAKPVKRANVLPTVLRQIVKDLLDVQFTGFLDTAVLEGDWLRLTRAWVLNERPSDLGIWGTVANGDPLVTITAPGYVNDLKKKQEYAIVRNEFAATYPDICSIRPGAFITDTFVFTGNGTAGREPFQDKYNALEWFLGSYDYLVRARDVDTSRSVVHIDVEVTNRSNWQSESRIPPSWQEKTIGLSVGGVTLIQPRNIPPYLIPDWVGQGGRPGAAFQERFIWQDSMQYPWVPIPVNPALPPPPVHFG